MAIILPNTRNAIGVPNRYNDLAAAGLRYTPPPVYRYDAYDVQGDEATLYEEGIDLADYQYNADSYDAEVLPEGYSAITGGGGSFLVGAVDSKLYYRDSGGIGLPTNSPSGLTAIAYNGDAYGNSYGCLAINAGALYNYVVTDGSVITHLIDNTREWTAISCCPHDPATKRPFAIGVADGKLMGIMSLYYDSFLYTLSSATGWKIAGGVQGEYFEFPYGTRVSSLVISQSGYLHQVSAALIGQDVEGRDIFSPALSEALDLGTGWQQISGYMKEFSVPDGYQTADHLNYIPSADHFNYIPCRMYGIQSGFLFSLRHGTTPELGAPYKTQITEFSDWWRVVFVAPDEAVAIRKIAL